jgi:hypothetical protein
MIKFLRIAFIVWMATLSFLLTCSKKKPNGPEPTKYKWTILGYFDGNNSQDQMTDGRSFVIRDLQELEQIDSTDDVHILVMLGSFKTDGNCRYYHVERHLNEPADSISSEVVLEVGKKNMSDYTTLRDFIGYGTEHYPADHYMLIINDHGSGWKGVCSDTINGVTGNWMSLPDLSFALSGYEFDIIWFYAPSMATAEVAYQIKDQAEYMIASQLKWDTDSIMGSNEWLPELTDNPDISVRLFAQKITEAIKNAAEQISPDKNFQSVLFHLTKISQLATDVSSLSRDLIDSTGAFWADVWDAWNASDFPYDCDSAIVDLREFARKIQEKTNLNPVIINDAQAVETSVEAVVLTQYNYLEYSRFSGVSIHLPWNYERFDSTDYVQLDFSETDWYSFVSIFLQSFSDNYAATLEIQSDPTGARIFLNGVDTGYETNTVITGLFPGLYNIKFVKSGCQDMVESGVQVNPREFISVFVHLTCP